MATNESTRGGTLSTAANIIGILLGIATLGAVVMIALPFINTKALGQIIVLPTADVRAQPQPNARPIVDTPRQPVAVPANTVQQGIDAYNATQTALMPPVQNIDQLPADAPMPQYVEKQAPERVPAGADNVSIAEPTPDDAHGSKQTEPVNIQETHQCLHGQVWTDTGCHRPTPVR